MEFRSVESTHCFEVDDVTGLPSALVHSGPAGGRRVGIEAVIECEVGGTERRSPTGGIEYVDTIRLSDCVRTADTTLHESPNGRTWRVPVRIGGSVVDDGVAIHQEVFGEVLYTLKRLGPACSMRFDFIGAQTIMVRNLVFSGSVQLGDNPWAVTAPGNGIAGATPLDVITSPVGISPIGGLRGSSGLIHLEPVNSTSTASVSTPDSSSSVRSGVPVHW